MLNLSTTIDTLKVLSHGEKDFNMYTDIVSFFHTLLIRRRSPFDSITFSLYFNNSVLTVPASLLSVDKELLKEKLVRYVKQLKVISRYFAFYECWHANVAEDSLYFHEERLKPVVGRLDTFLHTLSILEESLLSFYLFKLAPNSESFLQDKKIRNSEII